MASVGKDDSPLFGEAAAGTLRLVIYIVAAGCLMVADYRGRYLDTVRSAAGELSRPLLWLAAAPTRGWRALSDNIADRNELRAENELLRQNLLLNDARLARLTAVAEQNERLRELLHARARLGLKVQLAELIDVDLDPFRHRVLVDRGSADGVSVGLAAMDAHGVLGQVVSVEPHRSVLILLTDASAAIPIRIERNGFRTVAYGSGDPQNLRLPHIPFSADVRVGDVLVTSGIGGRFPAGLPVGRLERVEPDDSATFVVATAKPAAGMAKSGEVLLLHETREALPADIQDGEFVGPPAPTDATGKTAR